MTDAQKDLLERLGDLGEEAIARLAEVPGMGRVAQLLVTTRDRLDDLQRAVSGIDALERRVQELERRVEELGARPAGPPPPPPPVAEPGRTEAAAGGLVPPVPQPPPPPGPDAA